MTDTVPVRISRPIHDEALKVKDIFKNGSVAYMDKGSWFSYLIQLGIKMVKIEAKTKTVRPKSD